MKTGPFFVEAIAKIKVVNFFETRCIFLT